jgi:hypothetical protein
MNELIGLLNRNRFAYSSTKKKWKQLVIELSKDLPRFEGKVWIHCVYTVTTRANDPDNVRSALKFILDGLTPPTAKELDRHWVIKSDNLTVIQSPIIEEFVIGKERTVTITISDKPLYRIEPLPRD